MKGRPEPMILRSLGNKSTSMKCRSYSEFFGDVSLSLRSSGARVQVLNDLVEHTWIHNRNQRV
jgi:hypothetical protein